MSNINDQEVVNQLPVQTIKASKKGWKRFLGFFNEKTLWVTLYLSLIALACIYFALNRAVYSDFYPANGDFQNYNGYRRLLDGQIPFQDFYFYLGLGVLYVNALPLLLLGNDFTSSLIVTNLLTSIMMAGAVFITAKANQVSSKRSIVLTLVFIMAGFHYPYFYFIKDYFAPYTFLAYIGPNNSDRMVRAFLPFLLVALFWAYKQHVLPRFPKFRQYYDLQSGFFLGAFVPWSNDYGISCFLAGSLLYVLLYFRFNKQSWLGLLKFSFAALLGCFISVSLLTFGNFIGWFDYNFLGVAAYQFWYYSTSSDLKLLSLSQIPYNVEIVVCAFIILYLIIKVVQKQHSSHDVYLLFLFLSTYIASYAYAFGSEKHGLFWPLYMVMFATLFSWGINAFDRIKLGIHPLYKKIGKQIGYTVFFLFCASLVADRIQHVKSVTNAPRAIYIPQLNGYLSAYGDELPKIAEKVIQDNLVFSTYASALEVIAAQYHPTGLDYIIHVLGDQYRKAYLERFNEVQPLFVTTMREDFFPYELWVKRANWFFYREFLNAYRPTAASSYNIVWKKLDQPLQLPSLASINITVNQLAENSLEIYAKGDTSLQDHIIDLSISYQTAWNQNRWGLDFGLKKLVTVQDEWSSTYVPYWNATAGGYNLPDKVNSLNIPLKLKNGEGRITLSSFPAAMTSLQLKDYTVNKLVQDVPRDLSGLFEFYSSDTLTAHNLTDNNWLKGVSRGQNTILFKNTKQVRDAVAEAKYVKTKDGKAYSIAHIDYQVEWIHVVLNETPTENLGYPTPLLFLKEEEKKASNQPEMM